jgi:hypothetical protein
VYNTASLDEVAAFTHYNGSIVRKGKITYYTCASYFANLVKGSLLFHVKTYVCSTACLIASRRATRYSQRSIITSTSQTCKPLAAHTLRSFVGDGIEPADSIEG